MAKRTHKTDRLKELDKAHLWHPFTQMREWEGEEPLIVDRGRGNYIIDTDGNKYLDGVSSLWVNLHGHRKKALDSAVKRQLNKIAHSTLLGLGSTPAVELAGKLAEITPKGLTRVFYSDSGSTAVEIALKMSFQYWTQQRKKNSRRKFIAFTGAYHGDTIGSMSVGEIDVFVEKYRPLLFDAVRSPYPYCYRCPYKKTYPDCGTYCLEEFEKTLEKHSGEVAACIIEPVFQGASGIITSPPGFLKGVRRLTRKHGVLLIADEVATGFGRTGRMFACEQEGVSPDLMCLAKGITGGYLPLAATMTTEKIYRAFLGKYDQYKAFLHGHTYTGNPLGCAAALASLEVFEKEKVLEKLQPKIDLFKKLTARIEELPHVGEVRKSGLVAGIELVKDRKTKKPFPPGKRVAHRVSLEARNRGVVVRNIGDVIILMPPLSVTKRQLRLLTEAVYDSIHKVTG